MRVDSIRDMDGIAGNLYDYGVCIIPYVLDPTMVKKAQQRLIKHHDMLGRFDHGITHVSQEDGRFGRVSSRPFIPKLDEMLQPLHDTLSELYELSNPDYSYAELVYKPTPLCAEPGILLHADIDLQYNIALQSVDFDGNMDNRFYTQRGRTRRIGLKPHEVCIISGNEGVYTPILHGVIRSKKPRVAHFVMCQ